MHDELHLDAKVLEALKPLPPKDRAEVLEALYEHVAFEKEPEDMGVLLLSAYRLAAISVDEAREY